MIKILYIGLFLILSTGVRSQNMQTIASAGGEMKNSSVSLQWTVGQLAVDTYTGTSIILTQGFNQSGIEVITTTHKFEKLNLRVYPNPTSDILFVELDDLKSTRNCEIYNAIGTFLYKIIIKDKQTKIDLSSYTNGIYFVKIKSNSNETIKLYKIIKQ